MTQDEMDDLYLSLCDSIERGHADYHPDDYPDDERPSEGDGKRHASPESQSSALRIMTMLQQRGLLTDGTRQE